MAMQHMYSCFLWCKKECPSPFGFKLSRVAFRQIPAYANIGMGVHVMEWRIYIYISHPCRPQRRRTKNDNLGRPQSTSTATVVRGWDWRDQGDKDPYKCGKQINLKMEHEKSRKKQG